MISIVCAMYNEEQAIEDFISQINSVLTSIDEEYEIVCVDDGSQDNTLQGLLSQKQHCHNLRIISLSRNFGKEAAITAGISKSIGNCVIPIDADLQDPPELIPIMIKNWRQGFDVVLAKRVDRASDSLIKRVTASAFYKIYNLLSPNSIPCNVGDFRLMDRKVVDAILSLPERQRCMKGIFSWVGFNTTTVNYKRDKRTAGESKFRYRQLWGLAVESITSFSSIPLKVWTYIGGFTAITAMSYGLFILVKTLFWGIEVPGYASLIVIILFLGGIQLIGIGILGEYIARIYIETKSRPLYIIDKEL